MDMVQTKKHLDNCFTRETFIKELTERRDIIDKLLQANKAMLSNEKEQPIDVVDIEAFSYFKADYCAKNLDDIYDCFYDFLKTAVTQVKHVSDTIAFIEFDSIIPQFEDVKMTIGIRAEQPKELCAVHEKIHGIRAFHKGSYETIGNTYQRIFDYISANGYTASGTAIEWYHESFNLCKTADDYLTEVVIPVKDKKVIDK